jgi:hypothetical protein
MTNVSTTPQKGLRWRLLDATTTQGIFDAVARAVYREHTREVVVYSDLVAYDDPCTYSTRP